MSNMYDAVSYPRFAVESVATSTQSPEQRRRGTTSVNRFIQYIEEKHSINVPTGFKRQLMEAISLTSASPMLYMPSDTVDNIVDVCGKWKQYLVNQSDFDRLVCHELLQMVMSHVSVFSVYFIEKAGFELVPEKPGSSYAVIVSRDGDVREVL